MEIGKDNAGISVTASNMEYLRDTIREREAAYLLLYDRYESVVQSYEAVMACGHKRRYMVEGKEGTSFCLMCEFVSQKEA